MSATTHTAIVAKNLRGPLEAISVDTPSPGPGEVLVRVEWASPTPFDNWQKDFGLIVQSWPAFLGENSVGSVVRVGEGVTTLAVGDKVFGFTHGEAKTKAFQEYAVLEARRVGKLPANLEPRAAATIPDNFVTAFWCLTNDLHLDLPFDLPVSNAPKNSNVPILIWGGATSVGQYAIQLLRLAGYTNILATASARHSELLRSYGARDVFSYTDPAVASLIRAAAGEQPFTKILDCVSHDKKTIAVYCDVVAPDATVALLLPIQVSDESGEVIGTADVDAARKYFGEGVQAVGVRTHYYWKNETFYERMQPEVMPRLFADGLVEPNKMRVVEGGSLLARVGESLRLLREGNVSGEKLVFKVSE